MPTFPSHDAARAHLIDAGYVEENGTWIHKERPHQLAAPSARDAMARLRGPDTTTPDDDLFAHELLRRAPRNAEEIAHQHTLRQATEALAGIRRLSPEELLRTQRTRHEKQAAALDAAVANLAALEKHVEAGFAAAADRRVRLTARAADAAEEQAALACQEWTETNLHGAILRAFTLPPAEIARLFVATETDRKGAATMLAPSETFYLTVMGAIVAARQLHEKESTPTTPTAPTTDSATDPQTPTNQDPEGPHEPVAEPSASRGWLRTLT